jgi:hypothetical protein
MTPAIAEFVFWSLWFLIGAALVAVVDYRVRSLEGECGDWPSVVSIPSIRIGLWILCLAFGPFVATCAAFEFLRRGTRRP